MPLALVPTVPLPFTLCRHWTVLCLTVPLLLLPFLPSLPLPLPLSDKDCSQGLLLPGRCSTTGPYLALCILFSFLRSTCRHLPMLGFTLCPAPVHFLSDHSHVRCCSEAQRGDLIKPRPSASRSQSKVESGQVFWLQSLHCRLGCQIFIDGKL